MKAIREGVPLLGMSSFQVLLTLGPPERDSSTLTRKRLTEHWYYRGGIHLVFVNDSLELISN